MQQQAAQTQETEAPSAEEPTAPQEKPEETNV